MIVKSVAAKSDMFLNTTVETKHLRAGIPTAVRFGSEAEFARYVDAMLFASYDNMPTPPPRPQSVIPPPVVNTNVDKLKGTTPPKTTVVTDKDKCPKCNLVMVLTSDPARPGVDVLVCPKCNFEIVMGNQGAPVVNQPNLSGKKVFNFQKKRTKKSQQQPVNTAPTTNEA